MRRYSHSHFSEGKDAREGFVTEKSNVHRKTECMLV